MYKISYDPASQNGDYSCEIIYKIKNSGITVWAEKINGRTTANVRFAFYKMLAQIIKLTSYIRRTLDSIFGGYYDRQS